MAAMIYFIVKFAQVYIFTTGVAEAVKVPPIIPLIPYLPELFNIDYLPSFPFTYWILIIAIIAIPHEFAHGIFARLNALRVHSTGFGFLGPFLAAFVEPDEKAMNKLPKMPQMAILAAGTFANVLTTILFAAIMFLFFSSFFTPAGVLFSTYAVSAIAPAQSQIAGPAFNFTSQQFGNQPLELIPIQQDNQLHYTSPRLFQQALDNNIPQIEAFDDTPAFNAKLAGAITHIDDHEITSLEELQHTLREHVQPGQTVEITTAYLKDAQTTEAEIKTTSLTLADREGVAFLGIGSIPLQRDSLMGKVYNLGTLIKNPQVYYESSIGDFGWFVYNFLWWTVLICISVALVNMLPVGIFDGGRFFYLTIAGLTGSEKIGRKAFAISTWLILLLVAALMVKWVFLFL
jgi:membrane-associated protease RseP (regulator of RpoE activity)